MFVQIEALWVYPIKSCAGVALERARVEPAGLELDRRWMVVDEAGVFMTQRELALMASVRLELEQGALRARDAAGHTLEIGHEQRSGEVIQARVWEDVLEAERVGEEADRFFTRALGRRCRLVRLPAADARAIRWPGQPASGVGQHVSFADGFPSLLTAVESLDALSEALSRPVEMLRFRPNIVVSGAAPFAEDGWRALRAASGLELRCVKPCSRCVMVNVDPARAASDGAEPLRALARLHTVEVEPGKRRVVFGQNCAHSGSGELYRGQRLEVFA